METSFMPNRTASSENNRANEGNQWSRHHHTKGAGSSFPSEQELREQQQQEGQAHEYYPDFDKTGKGVNPDAPVQRAGR